MVAEKRNVDNFDVLFHIVARKEGKVMFEMVLKIAALLGVCVYVLFKLDAQYRSWRIGTPLHVHHYRAVLLVDAETSVHEAYILGRNVGWWIAGLVVLKEQPGAEIVLYRQVRYFGWWVSCGEYLAIPPQSDSDATTAHGRETP